MGSLQSVLMSYVRGGSEERQLSYRNFQMRRQGPCLHPSKKQARKGSRPARAGESVSIAVSGPCAIPSQNPAKQLIARLSTAQILWIFVMLAEARTARHPRKVLESVILHLVG